MKKIVIYSTAVCPYCVHAKQLLESLNISYEEIRVDVEPHLRSEMEQISGRRTVPQIFIGEKHVGGFDDLKTLHERGELNDWIK